MIKGKTCEGKLIEERKVRNQIEKVFSITVKIKLVKIKIEIQIFQLKYCVKAYCIAYYVKIEIKRGYSYLKNEEVSR